MSIINDGNGENKRARIFDPQIKSRPLEIAKSIYSWVNEMDNIQNNNKFTTERKQ